MSERPSQEQQQIAALQAKVRELAEVVQHYATCDEHRRKEWQADLDRLHQVEAENAALRAELDRLHKAEQERDQVRARVGELEEALRWALGALPETGQTRYYVEARGVAQRALEGKEEHGTKSND